MCFISSTSYRTQLLVEDLLNENEVSIVKVEENISNKPLNEILKSILKKVDFAIFLIDKTSNSIQYEIGLCDGIGIPIFIITENDLGIGDYAKYHFHIQTKINKESILKEALSNYINDIRNGKSYKYVEDYKRNKEEVKSRRNISEIDISQKFIDILNNNNIKYVQNDKKNGADFIIWSNEIQNYFGSPVIVEIKKAIKSETEITNAISQLNKYMDNSDAKASILITATKIMNEKILYKNQKRRIIVIPFYKLLDNRYAEHLIESIVINLKNLENWIK